MLKKLSMTVLALVMSLGVLSTVEAASDQARDNYCCRGAYCYNQNYARQGDQSNGEYCGGWCGCR